jgi:hypothetical protein
MRCHSTARRRRAALAQALGCETVARPSPAGAGSPASGGRYRRCSRSPCPRRQGIRTLPRDVTGLGLTLVGSEARALELRSDQCRRRDSNPRHADHDSGRVWLGHRGFRVDWTRGWTQLCPRATATSLLRTSPCRRQKPPALPSTALITRGHRPVAPVGRRQQARRRPAGCSPIPVSCVLRSHAPAT